MSVDTVHDNRRMTIRVMGVEIMRSLHAVAQMHGGDLIEALVFTGVWTANTQHLTSGAGARYASIHAIPPDSQRRPVALDDLQAALCMPVDIVERYIVRLIDRGYCEQTATGYVVPTAVFTRPEMLDGLNEVYARTMGLVAALRTAGFSVGEAA